MNKNKNLDQYFFFFFLSVRWLCWQASIEGEAWQRTLWNDEVCSAEGHREGRPLSPVSGAPYTVLPWWQRLVSAELEKITAVS